MEGSLSAAARELTGYQLDLVGVKEVRWDKGGTVKASSMEKKRKSSTGNRIFVHHRIVSAVKRVDFVSDI
jgi:hypothetical protein